MSQVTCLCGNRISDVGYPNKAVGYLISSIELDRQEEDIEIDVIDISMSVRECYVCGRLGIYSTEREIVKWYYPENGMLGELLK